MAGTHALTSGIRGHSLAKGSRWLAAGLCASALGLAACGAEEPPQAAITLGVTMVVTLHPPTRTPEPTLTAPATEIPTPGPQSEQTLKSAYEAALTVQSAEALLEEVAARIQDGKLAGFTGLVAVAAAQAMLSPAQRAFEQPAPLPELAPVWEQGAAAAGALAGVVERWTERKIGASDVPAELEPVRAQIAEMELAARQIILDRFNLNPARLDEWRAATLRALEAGRRQALGE